MSNYKVFGQCYPNSGNHIIDVQGYGPMTCAVKQWDDVDFLLSFTKQDANGHFTTSAIPTIAGSGQETTRTGNTGFVGNGVLLSFACIVGGVGDLPNSPIVPGTLVIAAAGGGVANAQDIYGDGNLYLIDDLTLCGTIDYEDGYLNLTYPTGHAPAAGNLTYSFQGGTWLTAYGNRVIEVSTPLRDDLVRIRGLAKKTGLAAARVALDINFGW